MISTASKLMFHQLGKRRVDQESQWRAVGANEAGVTCNQEAIFEYCRSWVSPRVSSCNDISELDSDEEAEFGAPWMRSFGLRTFSMSQLDCRLIVVAVLV
jgi:hypothetical protein